MAAVYHKDWKGTREEVCESCGGEGTVIEFHRFAGEYMAGEPVEAECLDCEGRGEFDDEPAVRKPYVPSVEFAAWCAQADEARTTVTHGDPMKRGVA